MPAASLPSLPPSGFPFAENVGRVSPRITLRSRRGASPKNDGTNSPKRSIRCFLSGMDLIAQVSQEIADLLPSFRGNRVKELHEIEGALRRSDLGRLQQIGERMYAVGNPYGFRQITTFGRQIRESCAAQNLAEIARIAQLYESYLDSVQVKLVEAPPKRAAWSSDQRARMQSEKESASSAR
jgi:hypothetical protein